MSEKLCLQWNDFQDNVKSAFVNLREYKDFADVTLACEDGQQVEAHKVILAASSPFFQKLLGRNKHPHPLIYMRGMKSVDMLAIIDFLYCGEADVYQEHLDSFLAIAEELQLKGLMGKTEENSEDIVEERKSLASTTTRPNKQGNRSFPRNSEYNRMSNSKVSGAKTDNTVALQNDNSVDLDDLDERVKSMMEKSENNYANGLRKADICKVCRKEGMGSAIKEHIEANHLEGMTFPCNLCEKIPRSRHALKLHRYIYHK